MSDKKYCPIMTRDEHHDRVHGSVGPVKCLKTECQFWIEVFTTENDPVSGCCHALAPRMHKGLLVT